MFFNIYIYIYAMRSIAKTKTAEIQTTRTFPNLQYTYVIVNAYTDKPTNPYVSNVTVSTLLYYTTTLKRVYFKIINFII